MKIKTAPEKNRLCAHHFFGSPAGQREERGEKAEVKNSHLRSLRKTIELVVI